MSRTQSRDIPLRGHQSSVSNNEQDARDIGEALNLGENSSNLTSRQAETHRKRVIVLIGSAILQMPIWGFAMSYGVFQEYYSENWTLTGSRSSTGVIGTTQNGVMYLSMPILFYLFTKRFSHHRKLASFFGALLTCLSFLLSSYSTAVWHLIATQGVLAALGCALMYSPLTLTLGEWWGGRSRGLAYGLVLSSKNVVGSSCPFVFRVLLQGTGWRETLRWWTLILAVTSVVPILCIPAHPSTIPSSDGVEGEGGTGRHESPHLQWSFLRHKTIWIYTIAIILQSAGYGIPQTYLNTFAHSFASLSQTSATLLLTLFNLPGILSSSFFGYLSDRKRFSLSAGTITAISALSSALSAFFLWGFTEKGGMGVLVVFSMVFGFFAGGYSGTWGGVVSEMEEEGGRRNEGVDGGLVYGLLNGARGIGYVTGGLVGVPLLSSGTVGGGRWAYGSVYGPLILFTGLCCVGGGWGVLWTVDLKRVQRAGRKLVRVMRGLSC